MASRRKTGGESCGAVHCYNSRLKCPGKSFYRFPKDTKRCKVWVQNTGRQDLLSRSPDRLHKGTVLCEDHFDPKQFRRPATGSVRRRLIKDAVPTIFGIVQSSGLQLSRKSRKTCSMTLRASHIATGSTTETEKGEEETESREGVTGAPSQSSPAASENQGLGRAEQRTLSEDMEQGTEDSTQQPSTSLKNTTDCDTEDSTQKTSISLKNTMDCNTEDCSQGQSEDAMDQNVTGSTQGQSTSSTDTIDQGRQDSAQGQSKTSTDTIDHGTAQSTEEQFTPVSKNVKLEPPWSMKVEPLEQPSAVHSPEQPSYDSRSGSRLSANARHTCQRCSAAFMLSRSLKVHMETFHRKTQQSESSASDHTDQTPCGHKTLTPPSIDDTSQDSVTSPGDFVIKLEPPWSMNEEPPDQPSAVHSPHQPLSNNSTSGSPLSRERRSCVSTLFFRLHLLQQFGTAHGGLPWNHTNARCVSRALCLQM